LLNLPGVPSNGDGRAGGHFNRDIRSMIVQVIICPESI